MSELIYSCRICGKQAKAKKGQPVPLCCKKEMEPLPFCTRVPDPEIVRADEDEPCQDGTAPKRK
jgi:hypothetical protein